MSTKSAEERFITWLRDAHAMERSLEKLLTKQAGHAEDDPAMRDQLQKHAEETRRHAQLVEAALERRGADRSVLKDVTGTMQAGMQGMMMGSAADTKIKDTLSGIAAEHFEIACYRSLAAAAAELGDNDTAAMCKEILKEEEAMAAFLEEQLPRVTQQELTEAAAR